MEPEEFTEFAYAFICSLEALGGKASHGSRDGLSSTDLAKRSERFKFISQWIP